MLILTIILHVLCMVVTHIYVYRNVFNIHLKHKELETLLWIESIPYVLTEID